MDPTLNPYAPGAGTQPPELAGRDQIMESARVALVRTRNGLHAKGQILLGLRGVGKTVLLNRIRELAIEEASRPILIEAPENRRLPELLVPHLRQLLRRLDHGERVQEYVRRGLGVLRSFASVFTVTVAEVDFGIEAEPGIADSGDLEIDLAELFEVVAEAAKAAGTTLVLLIDEVQYLTQEDLSALIVAVHKSTQRRLPLIFFGAGLPQLAALAGNAKSYAERLFDYQQVGPLTREAAQDAIREPARRADVAYTDRALDRIVKTTQCYPYFLQEWGKHAWNEADRSPIEEKDAQRATQSALAELDHGFFRVRLDRLTPREKRYMRAMAELGVGLHRSGDIATVMGVSVQSVAPLRNGLIKKGMIYSPSHGDTAFTVPMFDEFLKRTIPEWPNELDA